MDKVFLDKLIVILSMALDSGFKLLREKVKTMTPDELDDFIATKEASISQLEKDIENLVNPPT